VRIVLITIGDRYGEGYLECGMNDGMESMSQRRKLKVENIPSMANDSNSGIIHKSVEAWSCTPLTPCRIQRGRCWLGLPDLTIFTLIRCRTRSGASGLGFLFANTMLAQFSKMSRGQASREPASNALLPVETV
jgi:hypothetical protein